MTPEREKRLKEVISHRQYDMTVILENVHDPHNIGAVMRTCDSVGIREIFVVYTDKALQEKGVQVGYNSSSGVRKWVKIRYYENLKACFKEIKTVYKTIYGTHLGKSSKNLYNLNLTSSCAFLFGNEHAGISDEALSFVDFNFIVPQMGFVKSLNISVACAVTLYEALRQRRHHGIYNRNFGTHPSDQQLYNTYISLAQVKDSLDSNSKE